MALGPFFLLLTWSVLIFVILWKWARVRSHPFETEKFHLFQPSPPSPTTAGALRLTGDSARYEEMLPEAVRRLLLFLQDSCVALPVRSVDVTLLPSPVAFFDTLFELVSTAEKRIVLSALYLGGGEHSQRLVAGIIATMVRWEQSSTRGEVVLLFDCNRMRHGSNFKSLERILESHAKSAPHVKLRAYLFQTSSHLLRVCAVLPRRAREVVGVQHTKVIAVDDFTTIVTGANLSDEYFVNRTDRYVVFRRNPHVTQWFTSLVDALSSVSFAVLRDARGAIVLVRPTLGGDPSRTVRAASEGVRHVLSKFATSCTREVINVASDDVTDYDTWAFPLVQYGRAAIDHGSHVTYQLLRQAWGPEMSVCVTSPYLNTDPRYTRAMLANHATAFSILTSSPKTNGFAGLGGFAGLIPSLYLQLERSFYFLLRLKGCGHRVRILEYSSGGTTFHAKGLWVGNDKAVYVTTVGSSNMGCRSVHKDVEADVVLVTASPQLQEALAREWAALVGGAEVVEQSRWSQSRGRFQPVVALLAQVGKQYL